jgi:hypothetical protein
MGEMGTPGHPIDMLRNRDIICFRFATCCFFATKNGQAVGRWGRQWVVKLLKKYRKILVKNKWKDDGGKWGNLRENI